MYALYVCLICMPYLIRIIIVIITSIMRFIALYVCLICMRTRIHVVTYTLFCKREKKKKRKKNLQGGWHSTQTHTHTRSHVPEEKKVHVTNERHELAAGTCRLQELIDNNIFIYSYINILI